MMVRTVPRRIFVLVFLVFLVSSVAVSATGLILFSSADSLASAAGAGPDTLLVYSSTSRVPETSSIPLSVEKPVSEVRGIVSTLPEVTAPVSVGGMVVFLRGANLSALASAEGISLLSGSWPAAQDNRTVVLGSDLAASLRVASGQQVGVFSFFQNKTYILTVGGTFRSGPPFDDEVLTALPLAQTLRGFDAKTVTMLSLTVDPAALDSEALQATVASLKAAAPSSSPVNLALLPLSSFANLSPSSVIDQVLGRSFGLSESVFWAMVAVVAVACLTMIFFGLSWSVAEYSSVLSILNNIGLTRERATANLAAAFAVVGALAGAAGYLLAYAALSELAGAMSVRVFFHALLIQPSVDLLLFSLLFPVAAVIAILPLVMRGPRSHG